MTVGMGLCLARRRPLIPTGNPARDTSLRKRWKSQLNASAGWYQHGAMTLPPRHGPSPGCHVRFQERWT